MRVFTFLLLISFALGSLPTLANMRVDRVVPASKANSNMGRSVTVEDLLNVNEVGSIYSLSSQVQISPDGQWIVYQMRRTLLEQNQYVTDLWLIESSGKTQPKQLTHNPPSSSQRQILTPRWSPDSKSIAYFSSRSGVNQICLIHVADMREEQLTQNEGILAGFEDRRNGGAVSDFKWSPDGASIAFVVGDSGESKNGKPMQGLEQDVTWYPGKEKVVLGPASLCVMDIQTKNVQRVTGNAYNVEAFDWAPDSQALAFSASDGVSYISYMSTDLYIVERQSGKVRLLLKQPGPDSDPTWSPDGKWIAFKSQMGEENWLQVTVLGLVPASGGKTIYPTKNVLGEFYGSPRDLFWSADSKTIYFRSPYHMSSYLFRVPLEGARPVLVTPEDNRYYSQFSYSKDKNLVAFAAQSITQPADIYVSRLPAYDPMKLTDVNPQLREVAQAQVKTLDWRSYDNKWDIHAVLVAPPDYDPSKKYPLLVFNEGGPSMVNTLFGLSVGGAYPIPVFAAKGYLILAPNTRGRGGYGKPFNSAIGTEKSYGANPFQDVMAGVDLLVRRGVADPDRLGILGFSYGGYLSAYSVTQTNRFKAASVGDGPIDMLSTLLLSAGNPSARSLQRDLQGFGTPYDPKEREEIMRQSPIYHIQNTETPVLLEYGETGHAGDAGRVLFQGLQYFKIPSEFIVYPRTGHGITEPLLLADSYRHNLAWFDYWLLGTPYLNAAKQAQYDSWKEKHPEKASSRN